MITSVKQKENGFLVNDTLFVPNDTDNRDFQALQKWIEEGGVVENATPETTT